MTTTTLPTHDLCEDHSPADFMDPFAGQIQEFRDSGTATKIVETQAQLFDGDRISVPTYVNEFWTARQRQASSLHGVSYRACSKPQLPRFFIQRLTQPGDVVYDPFMGRGTTPVEASSHPGSAKLLNRSNRTTNVETAMICDGFVSGSSFTLRSRRLVRCCLLPSGCGNSASHRTPFDRATRAANRPRSPHRRLSSSRGPPRLAPHSTVLERQ
jgi:hypothetical protein